MDQEMDLRMLFKLIVKRWKAIVGVPLIFVVLALAFSFLVPRAYEATMILEVGQLYLSAQAWKHERQFIEEPEAAAKVLASYGVLEQIRRRLGLEVNLRSLGKRLEIETFLQDREYLPILDITAEGSTPREAVEMLNAMADLLIARHGEKYEVYRRGLEERIARTREKIEAYKTIISAQEQHRDLSQQYIDQGRTSVEDFLRELAELDSAASSAVDMLYLQGSALAEKKNVTDLARFKAEMDIEIGLNRKEMADSEIIIVELESRGELSTPTRIISPAVATDKPVKPNRPLVVVLAAVVGFSLALLFAVGREYLRE